MESCNETQQQHNIKKIMILIQFESIINIKSITSVTNLERDIFSKSNISADCQMIKFKHVRDVGKPTHKFVNLKTNIYLVKFLIQCSQFESNKIWPRRIAKYALILTLMVIVQSPIPIIEPQSLLTSNQEPIPQLLTGKRMDKVKHWTEVLIKCITG